MAEGETIRLRSADFRRERQRQWAALERLVERVERSGLRALDAGELHRLPSLYRAAVSSLSVARSISLDRALLTYLESLVARAYFCVYGVKPRPRRLMRDFLLDAFPQTVRRLWAGVLLALLVMTAGTFIGLSLDSPEAFAAIVPEQLAAGRGPTSTDEQLRQVLYSGDEQGGDELSTFAAYLFTHNAKVGLFSFALGFALGLPAVLLLFYNGLVLGAMAGLYHGRGLGLDFWAWVLPHGVTELLAVGLCGGAGLAVALALVRPGPYGRLHGLASTGRQAALIVLGAVLMLAIAGLIEGVFRQRITDLASRLAVAGASLLFWTVYFTLRGRAPAGRRGGPDG